MLERKKGLGVGENIKKERELSDVRGKGEEPFSSEYQRLNACQLFSVKFRTNLQHFQIIIS